MNLAAALLQTKYKGHRGASDASLIPSECVANTDLREVDAWCSTDGPNLSNPGSYVPLLNSAILR